MPRSQHRPRRRWTLGLIALTLLTLLGSGCYYGPDHPRRITPVEPPYQANSTPGKRIIVYDGRHQSVMKLRLRSRHTRVYDAQMIPVGQIRLRDDTLQQRSRCGTSRDVVPDDRRGGHLDQAWRLQRHDDHNWTITDAQDQPLARLTGADDRPWQMHPLRAPDGPWRVDRDRQPPAVIDDQGLPILTVPRHDFSDLTMLLLTLDDLSPLDRYTLAAFAERQIPPHKPD